MKIYELQQPSVKLRTHQLLDNLREQASVEAEGMMDQYIKDKAENPNTPHPNEFLDKQLDELFHAIK